MKKPLIYFSLLLLLQACPEKEPEPVVNHGEVLFGNKQWKITSITSDKPREINSVSGTDWLEQLDPCQWDDFFKATTENEDVILLGVFDGDNFCDFEERMYTIAIKKVTPEVLQVVLCCGMERRIYGSGGNTQENWNIESVKADELVFRVNKTYEEEFYDVQITFSAF